jgi:hypothetical protein
LEVFVILGTMPGDEFPSWVPVTESAKKQWKKKLQSNRGKTFQYSVNGWQTASPLYVSDSSEISFSVGKEDGCVRCEESGCPHPNFGLKDSTRSEYHCHRHITSFHKPLKRTKGSSSSSEKEKSGGKQKTLFSHSFTVQKNKTQKRSDDDSPSSSSRSLADSDGVVGVGNDVSKPDAMEEDVESDALLEQAKQQQPATSDNVMPPVIDASGGVVVGNDVSKSDAMEEDVESDVLEDADADMTPV